MRMKLKHNSMSVLTFNLWGRPRKKDEAKVLDPARVAGAMKTLWSEVKVLEPWVVGFQEYNAKAFDGHLTELWAQYSQCQTEANSVRIGVRNGVKCRVVEPESFARIEACHGKPARKYQAVEVSYMGTWVTVATLHLISGPNTVSRCKAASLGRAFQKVLASGQPGIVMGDMNWFAADGQDVIPITSVPKYEQFVDAAALDTSSTFPAWDEDLKKPDSKFAARLDRVFYTVQGLQTAAYRLINKQLQVEGDSSVKTKYDFISDHVGSFVVFQKKKRSKSEVNDVGRNWKTLSGRKLDLQKVKQGSAKTQVAKQPLQQQRSYAKVAARASVSGPSGKKPKYESQILKTLRSQRIG